MPFVIYFICTKIDIPHMRERTGIMVRREVFEEKFEVKGGKGPVKFYHAISSEEFGDHGRLFARLVFPPGSSIGWHVHEGEKEPYYIIAGEGEYTDSDGSKHIVRKGDCCIIEEGAGHCIENKGTEDLELIAMVYYVPKG